MNPSDIQFIHGDNQIFLFFPDGKAYESSHDSDTESDKKNFIPLGNGMWGAEDNEQYPFILILEDGVLKAYSNDCSDEYQYTKPFSEIDHAEVLQGGVKEFRDIFIPGVSSEYEEEGEPAEFTDYSPFPVGRYDITDISPERKEVTVGNFRFILTPDKFYALEQKNLWEMSEERVKQVLEEEV